MIKRGRTVDFKGLDMALIRTSQETKSGGVISVHDVDSGDSKNNDSRRQTYTEFYNNASQ